MYSTCETIGGDNIYKKHIKDSKSWSLEEFFSKIFQISMASHLELEIPYHGLGGDIVGTPSATICIYATYRFQ